MKGRAALAACRRATTTLTERRSGLVVLCEGVEVARCCFHPRWCTAVALHNPCLNHCALCLPRIVFISGKTSVSNRFHFGRDVLIASVGTAQTRAGFIPQATQFC